MKKLLKNLLIVTCFFLTLAINLFAMISPFLTAMLDNYIYIIIGFAVIIIEYSIMKTYPNLMEKLTEF